MLYLSAVFAILLIIGLSLVAEKPENTQKIGEDKEKLSKTFYFLWSELFQSRDFWFLFMTRYAYMVIIGGILTHWKTVSLSLNGDD